MSAPPSRSPSWTSSPPARPARQRTSWMRGKQIASNSSLGPKGAVFQIRFSSMHFRIQPKISTRIQWGSDEGSKADGILAPLNNDYDTSNYV
jgi:hypothetical protein